MPLVSCAVSRTRKRARQESIVKIKTQLWFLHSVFVGVGAAESVMDKAAPFNIFYMFKFGQYFKNNYLCITISSKNVLKYILLWIII
jgi:hypothetical protein